MVAIIDENAALVERVSYDPYGRARHHWFADVDGDGDYDTYSLGWPPTDDLGIINSLEGIHKEIKRRTRVASLFPNEAAVERLISAILCEIDEEWSTGRIYLNMEPL